MESAWKTTLPWWILMDFDGFWRILTNFDEFWRILTNFDEFWRILMNFYGFWRILMDFDGFWRILMDFDGFWRILMDFDGFWRILMDFWWFLMGFNEFFLPSLLGVIGIFDGHSRGGPDVVFLAGGGDGLSPILARGAGDVDAQAGCHVAEHEGFEKLRDLLTARSTVMHVEGQYLDGCGQGHQKNRYSVVHC